MSGEKKRVGVLSLHNSKETKAICNAVEDLGHEPVWLRAENICVEAGYESVSVEPEVDVVVNRLLVHSDSVEDSLSALGLVDTYEAAGIPVINPARSVLASVHKFAGLAHLTSNGYPVPPSTLGIGAHRIERLETPDHPDRFDHPDLEDDPELETYVFKRPIGTHGDATQLLGPSDWAPQLATETQGLIQAMINTPGDEHEDLRIYVVGDEAIGAMRRYAPDDDWRTNVARGGRVRDATSAVPDDVLQLAVDATNVLGLDVAGVDIIEGIDRWYVLEVNVTAGFKGFFEATGISPAPYIAANAIETAGGVVDRTVLEQLAETLDDSVPDCKPDLQPSPDPDESIVGYTSTVRVTGQHRAKTVVAKSDTGATRTSIDIDLASEIGAGPIVDTKSLKGSTAQRPVVPVGIRIGDYTHDVYANVSDRSELNHDVLLGRDILQDYSVQVSRRHDDGESAPVTWDDIEE